jgi:exodeoxyribonuclease VII small subunit
VSKVEKPTEIDFAANLAELEAITSWFESSEVDLAEALVKFERGMELAAELKEHLATIENKVIKIKQRFDVPMVVAPVESEPLDLFEKE